MSENTSPTPKIEKSQTVYRGYFNVRVDSLLHPEGHTLDYTLIDIGVHAVAILAKTEEGRFLTTQEYRHPTGKWLMGCPGGRIDPGETPLEAAKRELLEETGYSGTSWKELGYAFPFPSVSDQQIHYILLEDARLIQPPSLEAFEQIHIELKSAEEIRDALRSGAAVDGVFCTALLLSKIL